MAEVDNLLLHNGFFTRFAREQGLLESKEWLWDEPGRKGQTPYDQAIGKTSVAIACRAIIKRQMNIHMGFLAVPPPEQKRWDLDKGLVDAALKPPPETVEELRSRSREPAPRRKEKRAREWREHSGSRCDGRARPRTPPRSPACTRPRVEGFPRLRQDPCPPQEAPPMPMDTEAPPMPMDAGDGQHGQNGAGGQAAWDWDRNWEESWGDWAPPAEHPGDWADGAGMGQQPLQNTNRAWRRARSGGAGYKRPNDKTRWVKCWRGGWTPSA